MYHPRVEELPDEDSVPKVKSVSWANAAPIRRVLCEDDSGDMADSDSASVSEDVDVKLEDIFPKGIDWSTRVARSMSVVAAGSSNSSSRSDSLSSVESAPAYLERDEDDDYDRSRASNTGAKAEGDGSTTTVSVANCWKRQFDPSRTSSETAKKLLNWGSTCVHNVPVTYFGGSALSSPADKTTESVEVGRQGPPLMLSWKGNDDRPLGENIKGIKHGRRPTMGAEYQGSYRAKRGASSSTQVPGLGRAHEQDEASSALVDALQELSLGSSQDRVTTYQTAAPLFWRNERLTTTETAGGESACPRLVAPGDPRVEFEMSLMRENLDHEHNMRQGMRRKEGSSDHQTHVEDSDSPHPEFQLDVNSATKRTRIDVIDRSCDKVATQKPASPTTVGAAGPCALRHIPSKRAR